MTPPSPRDSAARSSAGCRARGVAATAKHFPGLGTARGNTDDGEIRIATPRAELDTRLPPFATAIRRGVDLVMVSNAAYAAFDPSGVPAVLSKPIVTGLLRGRLGFDGVAITDAMEAPGPAGRAHAAARALAAGVDVLLFTGERDGAAAYDELLAAAKAGTLPAAVLRAANARIERLKQRLSRR